MANFSTQNSCACRANISNLALSMPRVCLSLGMLSIAFVLFLLEPSGLHAQSRSVFAGLPKTKYAAILADTSTGAILYQANADLKRYPASLTKMMTAYVLFDALKAGRVKLGDKMWVSAWAAKQSPTKLYLRKGQMIVLETGLKALIVRSANDVAVVIAEHVAGSEYAFVKLMNQTAQRLGMTSTRFKNSNGLPNVQQVSTARDMLRLAAALIKNHGDLYSYFNTRSFQYKRKTYYSHNKLLANYSGTDGLKTGYTRSSGFNIATSAVRYGRRVIAIVMGGNSDDVRDKHMTILLDASFKAIRKQLETRRPLLEQAALGMPELPRSRNRDQRIGGHGLVQWVSMEGSKASAESLDVNVAQSSQKAEPSLTPSVDRTEPAPQLVASTQSLSPSVMSDASSSTVLDMAGLNTNRVTSDSMGDRHWSVQIGVFRKKENAEKLISKLRSQLTTGSGLAYRLIPKVSRGQTLYKARFVKMGQNSAKDLCDTIKRGGQDCFLVQARL